MQFLKSLHRYAAEGGTCKGNTEKGHSAPQVVTEMVELCECHWRWLLVFLFSGKTGVKFKLIETIYNSKG